MWRCILCVSVVCGLAMDSNNIRSSKESTLRSSELQRGSCSNRAQRKSTSPVDRQKDTELQAGEGLNRTKAQEMWSCVRSRDCAPGLCCARYLTGKRCQRIPMQGEACLLNSAAKRRRNLDRCDCEAGLTCTAVGNRAEPGKHKRQGVCNLRTGPVRRRSRHSAKKRTAERSC